MKYVYIDESEFAKPKNCIGVGAIITDDPISDSLISRAIENLRNDPDIKSDETKDLDKNTLDRGYFHASEDSKNGHSHLFRKVMDLDCNFYCDFHNPNIDPQLNTLNQYYVLSLMNSLVPVVNTKEKIVFYIEDRSGISVESIESQYELFEKHIMMDVYNKPYIQAFFPEVEFNLVDKSNAGVQCCDLLLWTINRKINGDLTWYNRISFSQKYTFNTESESWGGENITIGSGINDENFQQLIDFYPKNPDSKIDNNKLMNFFIHAVRVCEHFYQNKKSYFSHIEKDIQFIVDNKYDKKSKDYIEVLAQTYLRIFDAANLIDKESKDEQKEFLLLSKRYLALILRDDLIHGVRTRTYLNQIRDRILDVKPEYLEFT